jgi:hypothetical protein
MEKISKTEIRQKVEDAMTLALAQLELAPSSKKTKKLVAKASKKISGQLRHDIKKQAKKSTKTTASTAAKKKKTSKKKAELNIQIEAA